MSNVTHNCCQSLASIESKLEIVRSNVHDLWDGTKGDINPITNLKEMATRLQSISTHVEELQHMVYDMTPDELIETPQSPLGKAMNKKLPPTTPTRRVKPTVCPPAPARKGKYKAGNNKFASLASSDSDSSTVVISPLPYTCEWEYLSSRQIVEEADNGRRSRRPCTPGCCAPPTPRIPLDDEETLSIPDYHEYPDYTVVSTIGPEGFNQYWISRQFHVPDEIDLDHYDDYGNVLPFYLSQ